MKASLLFLNLFLFLPLVSSAQSLEFDWGDQAEGRGDDIGRSTVVDGAGNVYIAGSIMDTAVFEDQSGNKNTLTSAGKEDIFLAKYDSSGNYLWAINMGDFGDDRATSVTLDANGSPVITGYFEGSVDFDPSANSNTLTSSGSFDIFLAKYDPSGNYIWAKGMGGTGGDRAFSVALDKNGDLFITGYFGGTADFDPSGNTATLSTSGQLDAYLAKYDASGNYLQADGMGGQDLTIGTSVNTDGNGQVFLTGSFTLTSGFDPSGSSDSLTSAGGFDVFLAKYDLSNTHQWSRRMGGTGDDWSTSIDASNYGNAAITGYFKGDFDFFPSGSGGKFSSAGAEDAFLTKVRSSGSPIMGTRMGGPSEDLGSEVKIDEGGRLHVAGNFKDNADFDPYGNGGQLTATGKQNIFLAKYGPYGNFGRAVDLIGSDSSKAFGIGLALGVSGNLHLTGGFSDTIDLDPKPKNAAPYVASDSMGFNLFLGRYLTPACTTELTVNTTPPTCAGGSDGMAIADMSGGTTPYSYTWSSGDTTATADSLSEGIYLVSARDSGGCIDTTIFEIEDHPVLSLSTSSQDASCDGVSDGQASASPSGGVKPYSYQWSNGDTTATVDSLPEGSYSVLVTDSSGCQVSGSVTIGTKTSLSLSTSVTNADCGKENGSASASVSGGSSPYSFIWSSGDTTATADSLGAGSYTVQVTDGNGCEASTSVSVNNTGGISASIDKVSHVTCPGDSNGAIDISVSGGSTPYSYQWNNGATSQDLSGIPNGPYEVEVMDSDSCKAILDTVVEEPDPLNLNVSTVDASCGNSDGEASVSVSGGTPPYSYDWSSGSDSSSESGLSSGSYSVSVTDNNGCIDSATVSVSESGAPSVSIDNVVNAGCGSSDGSIFVTVTGGSAPYSFTWSNGDTTENLTGVAPGNYSLTVEDSLGCQAVIDTSIQVTEPPQVPICIVSVDSNSQHNLVAWEKPNNPSIKAYNVYKESFQAGVYSKIGTVQDSALSTFIDTNSDPTIQSYRYKIASVDSCGNESLLSPKHKTIHLTANLGVNDNVNLIWDDYVGFSYQTFYINRYTDSTGWEKIDSIAATDHSYTDANPPKDSSLEYVISVGLPQGGCTATRAKNYNNSISNAGAIPDAGGDSTSSIQDQERARRTRLYPNPTKGHFTLEWKNLDPKKIEVYDIFGQRIRVINVASSSKGSGRRLSLDLGEREPGVYWIRIEGKETNVERAVVVE